MSRSTTGKLDWVSILLYFLLVGIGWINIYSASLSEQSTSLLDFNQPYGRQLIFIICSLVLIVLVLSIEAKFYERFASIFYIISLVSLLGLFLFGKNISGATSWYSFGGMSLQPSEFAKAATALALAKYISDIQTNMKLLGSQLRAFLIIFLPALFIVPQPDPGSALVFASFFFVLHREGVSANYLWFGLLTVSLFIGTLLIGSLLVSIVAAVILIIAFFISKRKNKRRKLAPFLIAIVFTTGFAYASNYIFNDVFEQRHRDRFNIVLGKSVDTKGIGYNTNQSQIAIGSGGFTGKGFLEGTQTKGGFVPEQHTDYIFSTVGEEWGFLGSTLVVALFIILLLRLITLAERQKSQFSRVVGYGVVSVLFIHFAINIGMVIGLLPTIGIPLPFFSYGGSGLWGFTILLFIFLKLDSNRINEW
ncbi:rod shape-determining protein RodA [Spongiivirga citrea]|uniref:FtsW/RodA/SpoVE family cell cycle protein n=1 Tax=Spongiivirga citrea TaxID=1481457 RepID=A0A6M0CJZ1_9FLAO|nr:rod shape-determining protein RodA [Spongiivirga citrea]NER18268.1 FtsW/RodA/SpoVE family cell cycle protein [Spongiivirga citrea]